MYTLDRSRLAAVESRLAAIESRLSELENTLDNQSCLLGYHLFPTDPTTTEGETRRPQGLCRRLLHLEELFRRLLEHLNTSFRSATQQIGSLIALQEDDSHGPHGHA